MFQQPKKSYDSSGEFVRRPKQYTVSNAASYHAAAASASAPLPKPAGTAQASDGKKAAASSASETSKLNPNQAAASWKQQASAAAGELAATVDGVLFGIKKGGDGYRQIGEPTGATANAGAAPAQPKADNANSQSATAFGATPAKFF